MNLDQQMQQALDDGRYEDFERYAAQAQLELEQTHARLSAPGALASAALWYAGQGIAVFPLAVRGKQPLIAAAHKGDDPLRRTCRGDCGRQGHGLYDATTDPAVISAWWEQTPAANIGLPTGHLFDVIDIDGEEGAISYRTMLAEDAVPKIYGWATTGRDCGRHLYIRPTGDRNASHMLPSIDFRGQGGYVVAPPSITERRYDWAMPLNIAALKAAA